MLKFTITILIIIGIVFHSAGYDKEKAKSFNQFFTSFTDDAVVKEMNKLCPKVMFKRMELGEEFMFLDIRTEGEKDIIGLTLENTVSLSMNEVFIEGNLAKLPSDKNIVVVCAKGGRAVAIAMALRQIGYKQIFVLGGGLTNLITNVKPKCVSCEKGAK